MPTKFQIVTNTFGPPAPVTGDLICYNDPELTQKVPEVTDLDLGEFPYNKLGNVLSTKTKTIWIRNESNYDALLMMEVNNPNVVLAPITDKFNANRINKGEVLEVVLQTKLIPPATGQPVSYSINISGNFIGAPK